MRTPAFFVRLSGVLLVAFAAGLALGVDAVVQSRWTASPLQVDGQKSEWQGETLQSEKKPGVNYAFKNDGRNLYILLIIDNPKSLQAVEATGMAIYYNPGGTVERVNGTRFLREDIPVESFISLLESQGKVLTDEDKGILRTRYQYPIFEAYAIDQAGQYIPAAGSEPGEEPPVFRVAKSDAGMIYEFRIPLAPRAPHPPGAAAEPGSVIKVGFEWGGSAMKLFSAKGSWQSPQSVASDSLYSGAGETPAQEFLSNFDRLSRPSLKTKEFSFWVDVKLAPKP